MAAGFVLSILGDILLGGVKSGSKGAADDILRNTLDDAAEVAIESATRNSAAPKNAVPARGARVVPAEFADTASLSYPPTASEAWVTAADDLAGINTSQGIAQRLTLVNESGNLLKGPYAVIEFDLPTKNLATPMYRNNPGFVSPGTGLTAGKAREFVTPNYKVSDLKNVNVRIVK